MVVQESTLIPNIPNLPPPITCGHCGSTEVQSVYSIVQTARPVSGAPNPANVAALLSPPRPPIVSKPPPFGILGAVALAVGILFLIPGIGVLVLAPDKGLTPALAYGIGGLGVGIFLLVRGPSLAAQAPEQNTQRQKDYEKRMAVWSAAYYCSACSHVFLPGTGKTAPVEGFSGFLASS